jgi:hypothetical protein
MRVSKETCNLAFIGEMKVNFYGLTPVAFWTTGFVCPSLAGTPILALTDIALRKKNKISEKSCVL